MGSPRYRRILGLTGRSCLSIGGRLLNSATFASRPCGPPSSLAKPALAMPEGNHRVMIVALARDVIDAIASVQADIAFGCCILKLGTFDTRDWPTLYLPCSQIPKAPRESAP